MNANEVFPSDWLKASDIGNARPVVTIDRIEMEDMPDNSQKPVIHFRGKQKGLVTNKTNWNTLISLFGPETNDWIGQQIQLLATPVSFQGRMVQAIRVNPTRVAAAPSPKAARPAAKTPAPAPAPVDQYSEEQPPANTAEGADDSGEIPF